VLLSEVGDQEYFNFVLTTAEIEIFEFQMKKKPPLINYLSVSILSSFGVFLYSALLVRNNRICAQLH
jgi:hypothetical protein